MPIFLDRHDLHGLTAGVHVRSGAALLARADHGLRMAALRKKASAPVNGSRGREGGAKLPALTVE